MRKIFLIILLVNLLVLFYSKVVKLDANIINARSGEKQFNTINHKNYSSKSMNLFHEKELKKVLEIMEKEYGEINFDLIMKRADRRKVQNIFEDEKTNRRLNRMISYKSYEYLCLRKVFLPIKIQSKLKCRYIDRGIPFLKIAPIKEEEAYLEPRIVLFHDVIYENEIETVKKLAQPLMTKATFVNDKTGEIIAKGYRVTDTAWLGRDQHRDIDNLNLRVQLMTGLSLETAEFLQVAYYPLGGKYEPHHDFVSTYYQSMDYSSHFYDRIATVLFYLSSVEEGGATVFPKLDVTLIPKKGSAAFWYNLKPNGFRDYLTLHAACPVTSGSKWAANLWLSEENQEFFRPCTLDNQERDEEWERIYSKSQANNN